jgi:hypothetical protein
VRATGNGSELSYKEDNVKFLASLPVVGFRLSDAVTPRFHVNGGFDYFGISYDEFSGAFTDILVTAEYQVFDNWSAGLGLNVTSLDLEVQNKTLIELEQDVTGLFLYVAYNY